MSRRFSPAGLTQAQPYSDSAESVHYRILYIEESSATSCSVLAPLPVSREHALNPCVTQRGKAESLGKCEMWVQIVSDPGQASISPSVKWRWYCQDEGNMYVKCPAHVHSR